MGRKRDGRSGIPALPFQYDMPPGKIQRPKLVRNQKTIFRVANEDWRFCRSLRRTQHRICNSERSPNSVWNGLGKSALDNGQRRLPTPPARITGISGFMRTALPESRKDRFVAESGSAST